MRACRLSLYEATVRTPPASVRHVLDRDTKQRSARPAPQARHDPDRPARSARHFEAATVRERHTDHRVTGAARRRTGWCPGWEDAVVAGRSDDGSGDRDPGRCPADWSLLGRQDPGRQRLDGKPYADQQGPCEAPGWPRLVPRFAPCGDAPRAKYALHRESYWRRGLTRHIGACRDEVCEWPTRPVRESSRAALRGSRLDQAVFQRVSH